MSSLKQCIINHCHRKPKVFNSLFVTIEIFKIPDPKTKTQQCPLMGKRRYQT